jgi:hypothetical protein
MQRKGEQICDQTQCDYLKRQKKRLSLQLCQQLPGCTDCTDCIWRTEASALFLAWSVMAKEYFGVFTSQTHLIWLNSKMRNMKEKAMRSMHGWKIDLTDTERERVDLSYSSTEQGPLVDSLWTQQNISGFHKKGKFLEMVAYRFL